MGSAHYVWSVANWKERLALSQLTFVEANMNGAGHFLTNGASQNPRRANQTGDLLASLVDSSPQAILTVTPDGVISSWNQGAEKLYGHSASGIIGKPLALLAAPGRSRELTEAIEALLAGEADKQYETQHLAKSGALVEVFVTMGRMLDSQGYTIGLSLIVHDITNHKRIQHELARKTEELERSNVELEHFAYVASHDLQEPLRMVTSYLQLLARRYKGKLDTDADEFINYAVDGAIRMKNLIKDLLTYSRAGRGRPFAAVDLARVVDKVLSNLALQIQESGAIITRDTMPTVSGDESQLSQVLQNLISNSIKFRDKRPLTIHLGAQRRETDWLLSVRDNGIGIDPKYQDRIFTMFQRLHAHDEYPGTGIGLAVCRRIIERHGGKIWVESQNGAGATFCFALPEPK